MLLKPIFLIKFVQMKNSIKNNYLLIVLLCITIFGADFGFIDHSFSSNKISSHNECSDISNNFSHFHSDCYEDDNLLNDLKFKSNNFSGTFNIVPNINDNFKNSYISCIWQPPKVS